MVCTCVTQRVTTECLTCGVAMEDAHLAFRKESRFSNTVYLRVWNRATCVLLLWPVHLPPPPVPRRVPAGSPSRCGDVAVYVFDINQPSSPTPFIFLCPFLSFGPSTVFLSVTSPDSSPLPHSVLLVSFLPYWLFQLYISMKVSLRPDVILCGWRGLKHQLTKFLVVMFLISSPPPPFFVVVVTVAIIFCPPLLIPLLTIIFLLFFYFIFIWSGTMLL